MAKLEHVIIGTSNFFEKQVFSQIESKSSLFLGSMGLKVILERLKVKLSKFINSDMAVIFGIVDKEGDIIIPELIEAARQTADEQNISKIDIPMVCEMTLDKNFFELLRRHIEEAAKQQPPHGENESG